MVKSLALSDFNAPKLHTKYKENPKTDRIKKEGIMESNGRDLKTAFSRNGAISHKAAAVGKQPKSNFMHYRYLADQILK